MKIEKLKNKPEKSVPLTPHPNLNGEFCFTLNSGDDNLNSLEELLTTQSPLKLILTSNDSILSSTNVEWRHILRY